MSLKPKCFIRCLASFVLLLAFVGAVHGQQANPPREFPIGSLQQTDHLPASRLRTQIQHLPPPASERALQWLRSIHFTEQDLPSMRVDANGGIYYVDMFEIPPAPAETDSPPIAEAAVPVDPFPAGLVFHSRPGAPNVLFLNFAGELVSNTKWNDEVGRSEIPALPFSTDSDHETFSDAEQLAIRRMWQRVAEDYAPFNVNVTTERPASFNTRTAHALVTRNTDANGDPNPASNGGGVAYVNVFGINQYANYRPAWIYHNNLANDESYTAEAASHEIGHNMGLTHDGRTDDVEYYGGHGSGDISWGPIMGLGYNRHVSQWTKGQYYLANNTQDDLATVAGKISYRSDDHGNTPGTATSLVITDGTNIVSTTPENDPANANTANKGILERNTDADVHSFVTGAGRVRLSVQPWIMPSGRTRGGNVDLLIELYNEAGTLIAGDNPASRTTALIDMDLPEDRYYLHVRNSGAGDPFSSTPTGYTAYASIGQYFISGFVVESSGFVAPPLAELQVADITQSGQSTHPFTVTYSDDVAINISTLDSDDLRVTGPNGYDQPAQFVSVDVDNNGTPRVATYAAEPPSGSAWSQTANGTYTISMQTDQVGDTEGAWVASGELGQFQVVVPSTIYAAPMNSDPGWTLQGDWEYGPPAYASGGPVSGYTGANIIGYNLNGNYPNNLSASYAVTPAIDTSGSSTLTLRFRRWLRTARKDNATIDASVNGTSWLNVWSSSGNVSDNAWQEVQYTLPAEIAGSSTVRLRWGLSASPPPDGDIGWNIDDVELLGDGSLDTAPPAALLNVAGLTIGGSPSHSCSVTYTDDTAVRLASLDANDLVVTGPNGYSNIVEFVGADLPMDGTPITATYSIPAPGELWSAADNGEYQVVLIENEVEDVHNNAVPGSTLGSFTVAIPESEQAIVASTTSLTVPEGGTAEFTIQLAEPPGSPILVTVQWVSGDTRLFVGSGASHEFNSDNWSTPAPVVIGAASDPDQEEGTAVFECRADSLLPVTVLATIEALPAGELVVETETALEASGHVGGPFQPSELTYTLTNAGGSALEWSASTPDTWLALSPVGGTLPAGASTNIVLTIADPAAALPVGTNSSVVTFTDTTAGSSSAVRDAILSIHALPTLTVLTGDNPDGFSIRLDGIPAWTYILQGSTNLQDWVNVGTHSTGPDGQIVINGLETPDHFQQFYRALSAP